jgi:Fe-S cluster assembly protein SufD
VDPEHLYYLQSRGISKADAEWMIVQGFLEPVIEQLPTVKLRGHVRNLIEVKLDGK